MNKTNYQVTYGSFNVRIFSAIITWKGLMCAGSQSSCIFQKKKKNLRSGHQKRTQGNNGSWPNSCIFSHRSFLNQIFAYQLLQYQRISTMYFAYKSSLRLCLHLFNFIKFKLNFMLMPNTSHRITRDWDL